MQIYEYQDIKITKFSQSGFLLEWSGKNIYIDPYDLPADQPTADYILLTHEHFDHAQSESINAILHEKTVILANELTVAGIMENVEFDEVIDVLPDQKLELEDFNVETVPAYNLDKYRDDEQSKVYHPQENNGVGYILHLGDSVIYHAGDTDNIPELENLKDIDVAMFPISGTYVSTPQEAALAIQTIEPKVVIPMHHDAGIVGSTGQVQEFQDHLTKLDLDTEVQDLSASA